ncbi:MAG: chlorophyll synthesis pathway protein BchC [Pseudomonadota bacterium]
MHTTAVIFEGQQAVGLRNVGLSAPGAGDIVVDTRHSGISTGTEKLLWSSEMPVFPGLGYPLVPGYESIGEVVEAGRDSGLRAGQTVFVPGASCYTDVRGLFGGTAARIVSAADRVLTLDAGTGRDGTLLALAATAHHALAHPGGAFPDLIVGHGVLGRLLARLTLALGGPAPVVWEIDPARHDGASGYSVVSPEADSRADYACICDASGAAGMLDRLMLRLARGGEVVLAGFYAEPLSFAFPPAFMREARIRVAAEWARDDLLAVRDLVERGVLALDGLVTHSRPASEAADAYRTAFADRGCLKMILDWKGVA